jgi:hypothetical protein
MGDIDDTPSGADFTKFCKGIETSYEERRRDFGENPSTRTKRNLGEVLRFLIVFKGKCGGETT